MRLKLVFFSRVLNELQDPTDIISTDEDPGLRIEYFAIIKLPGVTTKYKIYFFTMQTFIELITGSYATSVLQSFIFR